MDVSSLEVVNGGKPEGGYSTTNGRGTYHGYWECNFCGASYYIPISAAQSFVCPSCGGVDPGLR